MSIEIPIQSSFQQIDSSFLFEDGFELQNQSVIPSENYSGSFTVGEDNVEFYVYDAQKIIQYSNYNFEDYVVNNDSGSVTDIINLNPEADVYNAGYTNGNLYGVYNFVTHQLSSTPEILYYISEISGDRTEIRIESNYISNSDIQSSYIPFNQLINSTDFFDEFYITFGKNEYHIGINSQLVLPDPSASATSTTQNASILIKLYDALPNRYNTLDELYVVTKTAETQAYAVDFIEDLSVIDDTIELRGPNTNLNIKDFVNNSTTYKSKLTLLGTESTGSLNELVNRLDQKGIMLTPNYSTSSFDAFVNFSSAKQRTQNFYTKVTQIQAYETDISYINPITGSNPGVSQISTSIATLYNKIENIIQNFDGWDYYLYYNTASDSYPKDTSSGQKYPYPLLDANSTEALTWLGSDVENDQYYGGVSLSASLYDQSNQNWLYYTIPTFITEQNDNNNYVEFCNMVGQSFDELWLYTKTITAKLNTTNVLDEGIPLSLADDVITSLGYTGFGNNYNNQDNFIGLIGNDNGVYVPPTGSELINHYIAINNGQVVNYWDPNYSWAGYVQQLISSGFPYPIDAVSNEIFKRLNHNMSYLVKKKGTIAGLRQLINIWGIPNTILRINEFGGKNKDQTDDYDLWYERYSYAYTPVANSYRASASAIVPWMPLERNRIADTGSYIVPDGVSFRFKTTGYPSSSFAGSFNSQSLAVKKSNGLDDDEFDWGIVLNYTGSDSGSYNGAGNSDYRNWAEMRFYISGSSTDGGNGISDPIYLPFYDKGWWSVLLQRDIHPSYTDNTTTTTWTLYAKNKIYNGWDGNSLGFEGSASLSTAVPPVGGASSYGTGLYGAGVYGGIANRNSLNYAWNTFGTDLLDGVYIGGRIDGAKVGTTLVTNIPGQAFSGSFQEFRYYSHDISESVFNDFVMNPESIEGNHITGSESSFDIVNFRAPLGNELESFFTSSQLIEHTDEITSSHPAITASADLLITGSFVNPADNSITSSYRVIYEENTVKRTYSKTNTETYFLDQPAVGFRNRISNKIQSSENDNFGTVLSGLVSIQKDSFISQSYTENLNQLEVAFSPQDEINDDIIASLGYGAIQEVLADPRFRSSSDDYYPELRKIAQDYFKKYEGSNVYDYLRLIKYFDNSLFSAIKNYVPARTSVSTGIVIHQNMLERNRYREPQVNMVTTQSYAITNIPLTTKNLVLTGSIEMYELTGSAGGSVNEYNIITNEGSYYEFDSSNMTLAPNTNYNLFPDNSGGGNTPVQTENRIFLATDLNGEEYLQSEVAFRSQIAFDSYIASPYAAPPGVIFTIEMTSSIRGGIFTNSFPIQPPATANYPALISENYVDIYPDERIYVYINIGSATAIGGGNFTLDGYSFQIGERNAFAKPEPKASQQTYFGIETYGGAYSASVVVNDTQEEFYDGEFSGSNFNAGQYYNTQYNPYRKVKSNSTDVEISTILVDATAGRSVGNGSIPAQYTTVTSDGFIWDASTIPQNGGVTVLGITGIDLIPYQSYKISYTIDITATATANNFCNINTFPYNPTTYAIPTPIGNIGIPTSSNRGAANISAEQIEFNFQFIPQLSQDPTARYSLGFRIGGTTEGQVSNLIVTGIEGVYDKVQADIYLNPLQQDQWQIPNTQSLIFETSDYNPLNNNVEVNRSSSTRTLISYGVNLSSSQFQPLINTPPLSASIPDSHYTAHASINPRYDGSRLQSLDYNNFTPSGTIGPIRTLPVQLYNQLTKGFSSSVALSFIDGMTSSMETGLNSWAGDESYGKTAVISHFPRYIAHYKSSYEQYNYWDSYQYNIDTLIEIPSESIAGQEFTPTSLKIDGSNAFKKAVSSTFEPNRKMAVSYDTVNTLKQDLSTLPIGKYDIGGGSIEFLTLNSNQQTRITPALSWSYNFNGVTSGSLQSPSESQLTIQETTNDSEGTTKTYTGFLLSGSFMFNRLSFNQGLSANVSNNRSGVQTFQTLGVLKVAGPQLAIHHIYNQAVKNQLVAPTNNVCLPQEYLTRFTRPNSSTGSIPNFWVNDGNAPEVPSNYYQWAASESQCNSYLQNEIPFIVDRGDILRIEGTREKITAATTRSINFIEDFLVTGIQNYHYSGSGELAQLLTGNSNQFEPGGRAYFANGLPVVGAGASPASYNPGGNYFSAADIGIQTIAFPDNTLGQNGGAVMTYEVVATLGLITMYISLGGSQSGASTTDLPNYEVGEIYNIEIPGTGTGGGQNLSFNVAINVLNMKNVIGDNLNPPTYISNTGSDNQFQIRTNECGTSTLVNYPTGYFSTSYPTFLETDRDPKDVLNLDYGTSINRFTIRRQVENETSVMGYNISPPTLRIREGTPIITGVLLTTPDPYTSVSYVSTIVGLNQASTIIAVGNTGVTTSGAGVAGQIELIKNSSNGTVASKGVRLIQQNSDRYIIGDTITILSTAPGVGGGGGSVVITLTAENLITIPVSILGGANAQTGQGFLIPNDLSEVQNDNALDIINQLRSKNAFPTDVETDTR